MRRPKRTTTPTASDLRASGAYGYVPKAEAKKTKYEELAQVRSRRDPGRIWTIKRRLADNVITCNCPAWVFKNELDGNGERTCKHIKAYREAPEDPGFTLVTAEQIAAQMARAAAIAARVSKTFDTLMESVRAASVNIETRLAPEQWRAVARELADRLKDLGAADLPTAAPVATGAVPVMPRRLRLIELDD